MPEKNKNLFGHASVAKPATMPNIPSNAKLAQMANMLRENPDVELQPLEQDPNAMAPGDLEQLIYLGAISDSKSIGGFNFDLRTLTGKEQNDVLISVSFLSDQTKFVVLMVAVLARAVMSVNGRNLDVLYRGPDFRELTKEQRCIRVVESWQQPLIDELYSFYTEMLTRSRKVIRPDDLKK